MAFDPWEYLTKKLPQDVKNLVTPTDRSNQNIIQKTIGTLGEKGVFGPIPQLASTITRVFPQTTLPVTSFAMGAGGLPRFLEKPLIGESLPDTPELNKYRMLGEATTSVALVGPAKTAVSALVGGGLGGGLGTVQNIIQGRPATENLTQNVISGAGYGAGLAKWNQLTSLFTNAAATKLPFLRGLTETAIAKVAPTTTQTLGQWAKSIGDVGLRRIAKAAFLETPWETVFYGIKEKANDQSFMDSFQKQFVQNAIFNIGYAGLNTAWDAKTVLPILKKTTEQTLTQMFPQVKLALSDESGFINFSKLMSANDRLKGLPLQKVHAEIDSSTDIKQYPGQRIENIQANGKLISTVKDNMVKSIQQKLDAVYPEFNIGDKFYRAATYQNFSTPDELKNFAHSFLDTEVSVLSSNIFNKISTKAMEETGAITLGAKIGKEKLPEGIIDETVDLLKEQLGGVTKITGETGSTIGMESGNPRWYREWYKQLGRQPTKNEWKSMAEYALLQDSENMLGIPKTEVDKMIQEARGTEVGIKTSAPGEELLKKLSDKLVKANPVAAGYVKSIGRSLDQGEIQAIGHGATLEQMLSTGGNAQKVIDLDLQLEKARFQSGIYGKESGETIAKAEASTDPVKKITAALQQAKPLEEKQAAIYKQTRAERLAQSLVAGQQTTGEAGFRAELGALKGEMPKVQFESIRNQVSQTDIDSLFNQIKNSDKLLSWDKIAARDGLAKLVAAEGGSVPTESELSLLSKVFPQDFIQAVLDNRSTIQKLFSVGTDVLNLPRAIMASFDMSAPLRQGLFLAPSHPKEFIGAFGEMPKYFFSEDAYKGLQQKIAADPNYKLVSGELPVKLALTDVETYNPTLKEEAFRSQLAEKIPLLGGVIKASDRAYSGFLNKLRMDTFNSLYNSAKEATPKENLDNVVVNLIRLINAGTGRGSIGQLDRASGILNGLLFSPKLVASRLTLLNPVYYVTLDPFTRKEALKSLFAFAGMITTTLGLASLGGAEVETDMRNADWGKIKIGNTRYDIMGGFQQYIKLAAQLISGKIVSSTTGKEYTLGEGYKPLTRKDILFRFVESKEAPVLSFVMQLLEGKNSIGESFDVPTEVANRFTPMVIGDMVDISKDQNSAAAGLLMGVPGIFGVGVQTYGNKSQYQVKPLPELTTEPKEKSTFEDIQNLFNPQSNTVRQLPQY